MSVKAIVVLALALFVAALPVAVAGFRPGDIIVAGYMPPAGGYPGTETGKLRQFASDGTFVQEFYSREGTTIDVKFSPAGVLHTAGAYAVARFANDTSQLPSFTAPSPYASHSLAFARSGDLFATTREGVVVKFANGPPVLMPLEPVSFLSDWADLAGDQCTLYYLRDSAFPIGRFDVCTQTMLSPLNALKFTGITTILILADGTMVATSYLGTMYHILQDGTVLRQYNTVAIAYGRDPDPRFVWIVVHGSQVARFDLQNDALTAGPFETDIHVTGIAIVGADAPSSIPALSTVLLALLALCVSVSAVLRLRE